MQEPANDPEQALAGVLASAVELHAPGAGYVLVFGAFRPGSRLTFLTAPELVENAPDAALALASAVVGLAQVDPFFLARFRSALEVMSSSNPLNAPSWKCECTTQGKCEPCRTRCKSCGATRESMFCGFYGHAFEPV